MWSWCKGLHGALPRRKRQFDSARPHMWKTKFSYYVWQPISHWFFCKYEWLTYKLEKGLRSKWRGL